MKLMGLPPAAVLVTFNSLYWIPLLRGRRGVRLYKQAFNSLYWILGCLPPNATLRSAMAFNSLYWILCLILDVGFLILDSCFYKNGGVYKLYSWWSWGSDQKRSWRAIMLIPWFLGMFSAVFVLFFHCSFLCYWVCIVLFHYNCFYVALDLPWFLGNFVLLWSCIYWSAWGYLFI